MIQQKLKLSNLDHSDIETALQSDDPPAALLDLMCRKHSQQHKAERVFRLLDGTGKGVVVLEDLQRLAAEMIGEDLSDEDLTEMVTEIDQSGDGILTLDDFIRLAALVDL